MLEEKLKNIIIDKFGSVRQFSLKIDIPYTTVDSILKRGIDNSNVGNVIKMCKALNISIDNLLDNKKIISNFDNNVTLDLDNKLINNINKIDEIENKEGNDLSILDNVLYTNKKKIASVKNLPIEKQEIIANAVKSVLAMIDSQDSN